MTLTITPAAPPTNLHTERHAAAVATMQPHQPRDLDAAAVILPDGRQAWPSIIRYRDDAGATHDAPPTGRFSLVIHDNDAYEELARSGRLYQAAHTGRSTAVIDNPRTS